MQYIHLFSDEQFGREGAVYNGGVMSTKRCCDNTAVRLRNKSTFRSRKNVIIYFLAMICILGIVAGFTNTFTSDSRILASKFGEVIVMEAEPPQTGSPKDHDLISNLQYTAYTLRHASHFKGVSTGKVVADIKLGSYTQKINNTRVVNGDTVFTETISSSSLKSVAEQKYAYKDIIIYRPSTSINGSSATFANSAYQMTYESYSKKYGLIPNQLSKYIVNASTIVSVRDENATGRSRAALNASENTEYDFSVPDSLEVGADGNYKFTLTLDPLESTLYYRNEVRTLAGADENPNFNSVRITVTMTDDWHPVSVRAVENYDIAIPVIGAMNCTSDITEVFTEINAEDGVIPERDFFKPYVDAALANPDYKPPEVEIPVQLGPSDYLASAFAPYISGEKNLDLELGLTAGDFGAYDIKLSVNLKTAETSVAVGNSLYAKYDGERVYLKLKQLNGYLEMSAFDKLMKDERIAALAGTLTAFDVKSLFGGNDMLDTLFKNCTMVTEDGMTTLELSFDLDPSELIPSLKKIGVNASIDIKDEDKSLDSIEGSVTVAGKVIKLYVSPLDRAIKLPAFDKTNDLSPALDFIPDAIATVTGKTYGIDGTIEFNGTKAAIEAYIDRTDGIKVDATVSLFGADISIKYVNDRLYASALGVNACGAIEDLPDLISSVLDVAGIELKGIELDAVKLLIPTSLNGFIDMFDSLTVTNDKLAVKLGIMTVPVELELSRSNGAIDNIKLGVDIDLFDIKANVKADLGITSPDRREIAVPAEKDCMSFADLTALVGAVKPYLAAEAFDITLNGSVKTNGLDVTIGGKLALDIKDGLALSGELNASGNALSVVYADNTLYARIGDLKFKLDAKNGGALLSVLFGATGDAGGATFDMPISSITEHINRLTLENGVFSAEISAAGATVTVDLDIESGALAAAVTAPDLTASLDMTVAIAATHGITPPEDNADYVDITAFEGLIAGVKKFIDEKSGSASVTIQAMGLTLSADISVSLASGALEAYISEKTLGVEIVVKNGAAYISVGNIKIKGTLDDLTALMTEIKSVLPEAALTYVKTVTAAVAGVKDKLGQSLDIMNVVNNALGAVKSFTYSGGEFALDIEYSGVCATLAISDDLSDVTASVTVSKDLSAYLDEDITLGLSATGITAGAAAPDPAESEYVAASELIGAVKPLLPLVKERAFSFGIQASALGQSVTGTAYVSLGEYTLDSISAQIALDVAGVPVKLTVANKTLYIDVNGSIKLSQPLGAADIASLLAEADGALGTDIASVVNGIAGGLSSLGGFDMSYVTTALDMIALSPAENGFMLSVDSDSFSAALAIANKNELLDSASVRVLAGKTDFAVDILFGVKGGTLSSVTIPKLSVAGEEISVGVTVSPDEVKDVAVPSDCIALGSLIKYISPVLDMMAGVKTASAVTLDIDTTLTVFGKYMDVTGTVLIDFEPIAVRADLTLFARTDNELALTLVYKKGILYVSVGKMKVSFDTANDPNKLIAALAPYIPALGSLDMSAFGGIGGLLGNVGKLTAATSPREIAGILFEKSGALGKSTLKQTADMIRLFMRKGESDITAEVALLDIPFDLTVNVTPVVRETGALGVKLDTNIMSVLGVRLTADFVFRSTASNIKAPTDSADYVPLVTFVTTVIDAVNTLTAEIPDKTVTAEDGTTTVTHERSFAVSEFSFDYDVFRVKTDEKGNEVVDKTTGQKVIELDASGKKLVDRHITVVNNGGAALRFSYATDTVTSPDGETTVKKRLGIEAHLKIGIENYNDESKALETKIGFPINIDLYVAPTSDHPEGLAYVVYTEESGYAEKISIDYNSVMELVAAVMDILDANDSLLEELLGKYRLPIDTTVFDSMDIAGLAKVRTLINNVVAAIGEAKLGLADIMKVWNAISSAPNIDSIVNAFIAEGEQSLRASLDSAIAHIKAAIGFFKTTGNDGESAAADEDNAINGALFDKVVNAVGFFASSTETDGVTGSVLGAILDNEYATGTKGETDISVYGSENKIDRISINTDGKRDGLDANTARVNLFDMKFTTGQSVSVVIPDGYNVGDDKDYKAPYSDLSKIKHLIFDVMNTANMLEFDIGGIDTTDSITLNMHIGDWSLEKINIKFRVMVKLIPVTTNGVKSYKTFASVELRIPHSSFLSFDILPECVTRLYFYDNVLYISGVKDWNVHEEKVYYTGKGLFGNKKYDKADVTSIEYVECAYTVDEFVYMMSHDITSFLDEFLYYLLPITKQSFGIGDLSLNIRGEIAKSATTPSTGANPLGTLARIFKKYTYNGGTHNFIIGLGELANATSMLSDLSIDITGANDGDDNIYDNYISSLKVTTDLVSIIHLEMTAAVRNAAVSDKYYADQAMTTPSDGNAVTEYRRAELDSSGLGTICIDADKFAFKYKGTPYKLNGNNYVINEGSNGPTVLTEQSFYDVNGVIENLLASIATDDDGKVIGFDTTGKRIQWTRPWKTKYENSLSAA